MINKFKVIDYITRKRQICRDLMINHKIPQYCFNYFYIRKKLPEEIDMFLNTEAQIYRIYSKGTGCVKLFVCDIPTTDIDKNDTQIKHDVMCECMRILDQHELDKQRVVDILNSKINILLDKKSTLIGLMNENISNKFK